MRLGATEEGRQALAAAIRRMRPGVKIQARLLTDLARAHLERGDVEQACQLGHESLAIALASETEMSIDQLRQLRAEMRPWEGSAAVREFDGALAM
jgi:hypothetical protein